VDFDTKTTLAPTNTRRTMLHISGEDGEGIPQVTEMTPQIPGQLGLDGSEQEYPPMLRLVK